MARFKAIQYGTLPIKGLETQLISIGDIVEWDGPPRGFLVPIDAPDPTEPLNRLAIIKELKRLDIPFFKGAKTEYLQALLVTHKGQVVL